MLWALVPAPVSAQNYQSTSPPTIRQLTIAAWIVQLPPNTGTSQAGTAEKSTWRNTFGRERKTARWRRLGNRSIDADIVVLKQLKSLTDVRRLFPARTHQVIASRAALANANRSTELVAGEEAKPAPFIYETFPAIAIRRRRGLRVTAIRHITTQTKGTGIARLDSPPRHIALAARIQVTGRFLWVMTPVVNVTCNTVDQDRSSCPKGKPPINQIHRWLRKFTDQQTPIIVATTGEQPAPTQSAQIETKSGLAKATTQTPAQDAKCEHSQRPTIATVDKLPEDLMEISAVKPSADRPCAAAVKLTYKD